MDSPMEEVYTGFSFIDQRPLPDIVRKEATFRSDDSASVKDEKFADVVDSLNDMKLPVNEFKYRSIANSQIRLLYLHPPKAGATSKAPEVTCSLQSFEFDDPDATIPDYMALSYYWGTEDPEIAIRVKNIGNTEMRSKAPNGPRDDLPRSPTSAQDTYSAPDIALTEAELSKVNPLGRALAQKVRDGGKFYIRRNLYNALLYLRHPQKTIPLWIDAICINQNNISERNAQVRRMRLLYSHAKSVIVWLGKPSDATNRIMSKTGFLSQIQEPAVLEKYAKETKDEKSDNEMLQNWQDFAALMKSNWFSRRWVVQEIALASQATVHCGAEYCRWKVFRDAVAAMNLKWPQIREFEVYRYKQVDEEDQVGDVHALGASVIVRAISSLFTQADNGKILEKLMSLESLISTFQSFEAGKPRDLIYALLAIASDPPEGVPAIEVDYTKATLDVLSEFLAQCFATSGSIDMICRHWAMKPRKGPKDEAPVYKKALRAIHTEDISLPSYMLLAAGAPFGTGQHVLNGRRNGVSFVGLPDRQIYCASKKTLPDTQFLVYDDREYEEKWVTPKGPYKYQVVENEDTNPPRYKGILKVKGFVLGKVTKAVGPVAEGTITNKCLKVAGWVTEDDAGNAIRHKYVPAKIWRTLVGNRDSTGGPADCLYENACAYCLRNVKANGHINTGELIRLRCPETVKRFLERVREVVWNRTFIKLEHIVTGERRETDMWGLGPPSAESGDVACILYGCSVPVILAPVMDSEDANKVSYYNLRGEGYIHGFMDGEAITLKEKGETAYYDQIFELH